MRKRFKRFSGSSRRFGRRASRFQRKAFTWAFYQAADETTEFATTGQITLNATVTSDFFSLVSDPSGAGGQSVSAPHVHLTHLDVWYSVSAVDTHVPMQVPQMHLAVGLLDAELFPDGAGGVVVPSFTVPNFWDQDGTEARWRLWRVHDVELHAPSNMATDQVINYGQVRYDWTKTQFKWRGRRKGTLDHARDYVFWAALSRNDYFNAAVQPTWAGQLRINFMAKGLIQH